MHSHRAAQTTHKHQSTCCEQGICVQEVPTTLVLCAALYARQDYTVLNLYALQPAAAEDFQAGKYQGPFGNGGPGSGGGWGGGGGGRGGRRGPNIAGVRRYDSMDAPPMGGG